MKRALLYTIVSLIVSSTFATGVNVFSSDNENQSKPSNVDETSIITSASNKVEITPPMKFVNGLLEAGNIDINADVSIKVSNQDVGLQIAATVSYFDLENIKVGGTLSVQYDDLDTSVDFAYLDATLYASTSFMKAKISTQSFIDGIKDIIPLLGMDMEAVTSKMPSIDIDVNNILNELAVLEFVPDEIGYKTRLKLNEDIGIDFYVDNNYLLKKVDINEVRLNNMLISLSADTMTHRDNEKVVCPETIDNVYDDYTSITNFISNAYSLFNQKQFAFDLRLNLQNADNELISLDSNLTFDIDAREFMLNALLNYEQTAYNLLAQYEDNDIYFSLNDLFKGKLTKESIVRINEIIESYLNSDIVSYLQNKIGEIANSEPFKNIKDANLNDLINIIQSISYKGNVIKVSLDMKELIDDVCGLTISIENSTKRITKIEISDFAYGTYKGSLVIDFKEYQGLNEIIKNDYEDYAPILTIYDEIKLLTSETEFAFDVEATVKNGEKNYDINGFLQFSLQKIETEQGIVDDNYIYANVVVNDGVSNHTIILDMHNEDIRLAYQNRNAVYGSLKLSTLKNMVENISELLGQDNELLSKLTSLIPTNNQSTIISQILNKNYENVSLDLLKVFSVKENNANIVLSKELLGFDEDINLYINYTNEKLVGADIFNIVQNDLKVDLKIKLSTYDGNLKLDDDHNYLDLNLLSILVDYGIPTINNEFYHLQGDINLELAIGSLKLTDFKLSPDIKIRNHNGDAEVFIDLPYIPIIGITDYSNKLPSGIKSNADAKYQSSNVFLKDSAEVNRHASIYIYDGYVYLERSENAYFYKNNGTWLFNPKVETYTRSIKVTLTEFVNNIYTYLLSDLLGFTDSIMELILNETGNGMNVENMEFDKLFTQLSYDETKNGLTIGLDMSAITGNNAINDTSVTLFHSDKTDNPHLTAVSLSMNISSMIKISGNISMVDYGSNFDPTFIYDYCSAYSYEEGRHSSHQN